MTVVLAGVATAALDGLAEAVEGSDAFGVVAGADEPVVTVLDAAGVLAGDNAAGLDEVATVVGLAAPPEVVGEVPEDGVLVAVEPDVGPEDDAAPTGATLDVPVLDPDVLVFPEVADTIGVSDASARTAARAFDTLLTLDIGERADVVDGAVAVALDDRVATVTDPVDEADAVAVVVLEARVLELEAKPLETVGKTDIGIDPYLKLNGPTLPRERQRRLC